MTSMSVSAARADMHRLIAAVGRGEDVVLTRYGTAVAVVIRPDRLRERRADGAYEAAGAVGRLLDSGRTRSLHGADGLSVERADALAAEVRSGRADR